MTPRPQDAPRLVVLTDRSQLRLGRSLLSSLEECAAAGLTHVVLRELDLPEQHRAALALDLTGLGLRVVSARGFLPGCVGVHLAAHQPVATAGGMPFGRSCHSADDVRRAAGDGAGWAMLGPFADSASKPGHGPPVPAEELAHLPLPVYALGGITAANAGSARRAGASGVAVMGAVMRAARPGAVVADLLEATA